MYIFHRPSKLLKVCTRISSPTVQTIPHSRQAINETNGTYNTIEASEQCTQVPLQQSAIPSIPPFLFFLPLSTLIIIRRTNRRARMSRRTNRTPRIPRAATLSILRHLTSRRSSTPGSASTCGRASRRGIERRGTVRCGGCGTSGCGRFCGRGASAYSA